MRTVQTESNVDGSHEALHGVTADSAQAEAAWLQRLWDKSDSGLGAMAKVNQWLIEAGGQPTTAEERAIQRATGAFVVAVPEAPTVTEPTTAVVPRPSTPVIPVQRTAPTPARPVEVTADDDDRMFVAAPAPEPGRLFGEDAPAIPHNPRYYWKSRHPGLDDHERMLIDLALVSAAKSDAIRQTPEEAPRRRLGTKIRRAVAIAAFTLIALT